MGNSEETSSVLPLSTKYTTTGNMPRSSMRSQRVHHKMLHHTKTAEKKNDETTQPQAEMKSEEKVLVSAINVNSATSEQPARRRAYLKIAPITIMGPRGKCDTYALLDGGSTVTIIETALAEQLALDGPRESITIQGVNGHENEHDYSKRVKARVRGPLL